MTDGIEAVTRSVLALALDAASLRQQAISANIANANAIGYVPQRVSFEEQLVDARRSMAQTGRVDAFALSQVRPHMEAVVDSQGVPAQVQLDMEAADMARNAVQYQALVKGLSRHFAILSMAAGDGRK
ncbi:flagellar basal-body rod protein FlgB [Variovorax boronicumulans]|uniref:flagellar basal body rod protein FlgB n=1 Tax=Variovorax boronicumulans TaxID=436515 RepID=UPI00277FD643|nr:flagellar basal body protein [Variovorax boronicumulans]MDQ0086091.1 flagellar basal-body rod protein FlgB [Variovorax boronicumulans]